MGPMLQPQPRHTLLRASTAPPRQDTGWSHRHALNAVQRKALGSTATFQASARVKFDSARVTVTRHNTSMDQKPGAIAGAEDVPAHALLPIKRLLRQVTG